MYSSGWAKAVSWPMKQRWCTHTGMRHTKTERIGKSSMDRQTEQRPSVNVRMMPLAVRLCVHCLCLLRNMHASSIKWRRSRNGSWALIVLFWRTEKILLLSRRDDNYEKGQHDSLIMAGLFISWQTFLSGKENRSDPPRFPFLPLHLVQSEKWRWKQARK